jgi:hypothetical protein
MKELVAGKSRPATFRFFVSVPDESQKISNHFVVGGYWLSI